jgi:hypothetical protein
MKKEVTALVENGQPNAEEVEVLWPSQIIKWWARKGQ